MNKLILFLLILPSLALAAEQQTSDILIHIRNRSAAERYLAIKQYESVDAWWHDLTHDLNSQDKAKISAICADLKYFAQSMQQAEKNLGGQLSYIPTRAKGILLYITTTKPVSRSILKKHYKDVPYVHAVKTGEQIEQYQNLVLEADALGLATSQVKKTITAVNQRLKQNIQ